MTDLLSGSGQHHLHSAGSVFSYTKIIALDMDRDAAALRISR